MAVTPQNPAVNPPVPGDPQNQADTASPNENFDVVINGVGYMLYRAEDQPVEMALSPTFIPRTNVQGDFGDNQNDFYMTWSQRDWSGGEGLRYFRGSEGRDRMYWDSNGVQPTNRPGQVNSGLLQQDTAVTLGGSPAACNVVAYPNGALRVDALSANSLKAWVANLSFGSPTFTQAVSNTGAPLLTNVADVIIGDNETVYVLQSGAGASKIYSTPLTDIINTAATGTWTRMGGADVAATITQLEWFNGALYGIKAGGALVTISTADASNTAIKDFGGGEIVSMKAAAGNLWLLHFNGHNRYRLLAFDGTATTEMAVLPAGWSLPAFVEGTLTTPAIPYATRCIAYQDGVVYIAGSAPSTGSYADINPDVGGAETPSRASLWFYASGNSGMIWQSSAPISSALTSAYEAGAITPFDGGRIAFTDVAAHRLMCYDPATGGVHTIATLTPPAWGANEPPVFRLEYDYEDRALCAIWFKDEAPPGTYTPFGSGTPNNFTMIPLPSAFSVGSSNSVTFQTDSYVVTSLVDFNSSLTKYYRSVMVDGTTTSAAGGTGSFDIYYQANSLDGSWTLVQANATPGTFYNLPGGGVSARSLALKIVFNLGTTKDGPTLRRISLRAVPTQPSYRRRTYALALFDRVQLKDGHYDTETPSNKRQALETAMTSTTPIQVSDSTMTNTLMVFEPENSRIQEVRPSEYIAIVTLREV